MVVSCLFFQRPKAKLSLEMNKNFLITLSENTDINWSIAYVFTFNAVEDWYYNELEPLIKQYYKDESVFIRRAKINMRFSKSNNYAIDMFDTKYILLINDDIEIPSSSGDWLESLIMLIESKDNIGTVTPVTIYPNGTFYCAGASGNGKHYLQYQKDKPGLFEEPRQTEWNNFSCVLTKK